MSSFYKNYFLKKEQYLIFLAQIGLGNYLIKISAKS